MDLEQGDCGCAVILAGLSHHPQVNMKTDIWRLKSQALGDELISVSLYEEQILRALFWN
jgi:hypothetical protein